MIAEAIRRPNDFWKWALSNANPASQLLVNNSHTFFRLGGWPWDMAFMQAAAYLAIVSGVPEVKATHVVTEVPFWSGLDKHTRTGKFALSEAARYLNYDKSLLSAVNFYIESASCNEIEDDLWWGKEVKWKLSTYGVTLDEAICIWEKAKPLFISLVSKEVDLLKAHIFNQNQKRLQL